MTATMDRLDDEVATDATDTLHRAAGPPQRPVGAPGQALRRLRRRAVGRAPDRSGRPPLGARRARPARQDGLVPEPAAGGPSGHRPPRHRQQDAGRLLLRGRPQARPARARHHAARRVTRAAVRVPRGHRGGAALPDVPGVRRPRRLRHRAEAPAPGRRRLAARREDGADVPRAVLHLRARRRGPDRPHAARDAPQEGEGAAPAARADHADPRHRGGAAPLLRPPLAEAQRAEARRGASHDPVVRRRR